MSCDDFVKGFTVIARLVACVVLLFASANLVALTTEEDRVANPRTVYFTVGDYQDLLYTPLDSPASIDAAFEVLKKDYGVGRVWWRGGQDEIWGNQFVIRDQSRRYVRLWDWWMDLQYRVVNTNKLAVKAAHDRGMKIWLTYGLFDNGSPADVGFGGFPYAAEDKIRIEHPEWAPVNKYGTWRQGGPIEFAYPEARKAMVDYLAKYTIDGGYDGLAFLSYAENYSMRYEDEFGYSQPIVDEFKKRHGVDIRTQEFDREAWAKLRGEYLTQFMRELHEAMKAKGEKVAVSVDGKNPNLPCLWNLDGGVRTAGRLWMDIETWVKEGIVQEINLYYPLSEETLEYVTKLCQSNNATVSVFGRTRGDLPKGADRIMTVNYELESGFEWENYIDFDDEIIPAQPIANLKSDDVFARRRVLTAIYKGKQTASASDVSPLVKDEDVYVRRSALKALAVIGDASAVPVIEAALMDPENSVRWQAAVVLAGFAPDSGVKSVLDAVARDSSTFQFNFVAVPVIFSDLNKAGKLRDEDVQLLIAVTSSPVDKSRETAWYAMRHLGLSTSPNLQTAVIRCLKEDPNVYARELALGVLMNIPPTPETIALATETMKHDTDEVVQDRAAVALASLIRSAGATGQPRDQAIADLVAQFRIYGTGCQRHDKDWGWREVGNSLVIFGDDGKAALEQIMNEKQDPQLADLAWRVLYLKQENGFTRITEAEDAANHARHPFLKFEAAASN
jgi:hypothetical protein